MPPSSVEIKPQFPAIAVIPEIADYGIVRAAQGSRTPPLRSSPVPQRMERIPRMRGFFVALKHGSRAKGAVSSPPSRINEYLSHRFAKGLSSLLALMRRSIAHRLATAFASGEGSPAPLGSDSRPLVGLGNPHKMNRVDKREEGAKIKIIIFSIKFDKFMGFFDKFLKIVSLSNDCNQKGYHINLSVMHSDSAPKKVFRISRICPQLPAFGSLLHMPRRLETMYNPLHRTGRLVPIVFSSHFFKPGDRHGAQTSE